jgi:hypothetical protein
MIDTLTMMIVLMGASTVMLSIFVAYKFRQQARQLNNASKKLSKALMWQLIGEAALGGGTLWFALMAYAGSLPDVPVFIQSMVRVFIFSASSLTTIHLYLTTTRLGK